MKYIDLHCDTLLKCFDENRTNFDETSDHITPQKLKKGGCLLQCLAHFDSKERYHNDYDTLLAFVKHSGQIVQKSESPLNQITSIKQIDESKINVLFTLEDMAAVDGKIERIKELYDMGIRMIGPLWNYENCFGYPNSHDERVMQKGATEFGFEAIEAMNELGIVIDVSHSSDGTFNDILKRSKAPFIASHSNARALKKYPRNLTDEMLKKIGDKGGVVGINFYSLFLSDDKTSRISDIIAHMKHVANAAGIGTVALGNDFDGIDCPLELIDASYMPRLFDEMKQSGFSRSQIEAIAYGNALRVFTEVQK